MSFNLLMNGKALTSFFNLELNIFSFYNLKFSFHSWQDQGAKGLHLKVLLLLELVKVQLQKHQ
jgi:hypothetical protein